jgi:hypothetical protein
MNFFIVFPLNVLSRLNYKMDVNLLNKRIRKLMGFLKFCDIFVDDEGKI